MNSLAERLRQRYNPFDKRYGFPPAAQRLFAEAAEHIERTEDAAAILRGAVKAFEQFEHLAAVLPTLRAALEHLDRRDSTP